MCMPTKHCSDSSRVSALQTCSMLPVLYPASAGSCRRVGPPEQVLPLDYDPDLIADYWGRRPVSVAGRCLQLLGIAGGFLSGLAMDLIQGKLEINQVPAT